MADEQRRHGCLRAGCCGCAGLVLALVLVAAGAGLVGWASRPGPADLREESHVLVEGSGTPQAEAVGATEGEGAARAVEPPARKPGLLRLELDSGTFEVLPAPEGGELLVEGSYDVATHELIQETQTLPNGTWSTRVAFRPRGGLLRLLFAGERPQPRLTVRVPRDLPLTLRADLSKGESHLELGGLSLEAVFVAASLGDHAVSFAEPTRGPLSSFQVTSRLGATRVEGLGNASPERVEAEQSLGELRLDLTGSWRNDADVRLRFRMGAARVVAPAEGTVEVVNAHVDGGEVVRSPRFAEAPAEAGFRIRLDASGSAGELRLER